MIRNIRLTVCIAMALGSVPALAGSAITVQSVLFAAKDEPFDRDFAQGMGTAACSTFPDSCAILWVLGSSGQREVVMDTPLSTDGDGKKVFKFVVSNPAAKIAVSQKMASGLYFIETIVPNEADKIRIEAARLSYSSKEYERLSALAMDVTTEPKAEITLHLSSRSTVEAMALGPRAISNMDVTEKVPSIALGLARVQSSQDVAAMTQDEVVEAVLEAARIDKTVVNDDDIKTLRLACRGGSATDTESLEHLFADPALADKLSTLVNGAMLTTAKTSSYQSSGEVSDFLAEVPVLATSLQQSSIQEALKAVQSQALNYLDFKTLVSTAEVGHVLESDANATYRFVAPAGNGYQQLINVNDVLMTSNTNNFINIFSGSGQNTTAAAPSQTSAPTCTGHWYCADSLGKNMVKISAGTSSDVLDSEIFKAGGATQLNGGGGSQMTY